MIQTKLNVMAVKVNEAKSNLSNELSTKFEALFPTWTTIVATVIATLILLFVLTKLVYKPVKKMVNDRRKHIQENIDAAAKQNNQAAIDRESANKELMGARLQASQIVESAKIDAQDLREQKIIEAQKEADKIIKDAQLQMEREKIKFTTEKKAAIVEVALEAAEKVIEKEINTNTSKKIIEDFIKGKK